MSENQKAILLVVLQILLWTLLGVAIGWCLGVFQVFTHQDDPADILEIRMTMNTWLGGIFGFLLGLTKAARG